MNEQLRIPTSVSRQDMTHARYSIVVHQAPPGTFLIDLIDHEPAAGSVSSSNTNKQTEAGFACRQFRTKNAEFCFNTVEMLTGAADPVASADALARPWNMDADGVVILSGSREGSDNE